MDKKDDRQGLGRPIARRDFLNGIGVAIGASLLPATFSKDVLATETSEPYYPPLKTGMRGNHPGSFDAVHPLAWNGDAPKTYNETHEEYDLVVVGGGLSGLAAALFFQLERGKDKRILILDNHDDFGGHAKRNEFHFEGHMLLGVGGSVNLEAPMHYSDASQRILKDIGINLEKLQKANDPKYLQEPDLGLFIKTDVDEGQTVVGPWSAAFHGQGDYKSLINQLPLSKVEKEKIIHLASGELDYLDGLTTSERKNYLSSTPYHHFLMEKVGLAPKTLSLFDSSARLLFGVGGDGISVSEAFKIGAPGIGSVGLPTAEEPAGEEDSSYQTLYFPDGNASVARLMVRRLIPVVADGSSMDDIATARFDYSKLDVKGSPVRIRLNSTVVNASQEGDQVAVSYIQSGKPLKVKAKHCIMACYNSIIPHLCPALPETQQEALKYGVKIPLIWTNVVLRNGAPFHKAGAQLYDCPNSYFPIVTRAPTTKMADYQAPQKPSDPLVVFMMNSPVPIKEEGQTARDQLRMARYTLLETPFSTFEREIREQLTGLFGEHGFDADRDIEAITVNRWAHGYAYEYYGLDDDFVDGSYPHQIGRKQFGRISIANSDSEAYAYLNAAVDAAWRAIKEQLSITN
jgi:spermidine dehydrogenase